MKFSLMTYTVAPHWPGGCQSLEEMAEFAVEVGFEALELSAGNLGERPAAEFGTICRDHGLAVSCINGGCPMVSPEEGPFREGIAEGKRLVDMAVELDCGVIMPLPGLADSEADKPRAATRIAEGLREVVAHAEPAGVKVTLEDFPNRLAANDSIAGIQWLTQEVPGLGLTFDNGNWMLAGDDPLVALQALACHVANVHIKDWELDPDRNRLQMADGRWIRGGLHGQGLIDHHAVLGELRAMGYEGYLAFEYEGPLSHTDATRQGMAHLRQVLAALEG
jgi:sugar phosphate isomerase/epimerase